MPAYKSRLNAQIQALRAQNNGNPSPAQLQRTDLLANRKKAHVQKGKKVKKTKEREQRRAKDAVVDVDASKDSLPSNGQLDASGDASGNENINDMIGDIGSPGPSLQHPKAKPENLRLPTPAPKTSSPSPTPHTVSLFKGGKPVGKWSMEDGAMVDEDEADRDV